MQIILKQNVKKLGKVGQLVTVKPGFARNYLLPKNVAMRATKANIAFLEESRHEIEAENNALVQEAETLKAKIGELVITIFRQASEDGRLYGSVTTKDLAKCVSDAGAPVSRSQIILNDSIKEIGVVKAAVHLHADVELEIIVNVARTEGEAAEALKAFKEGKKKQAKKHHLEEAIEVAIEEEAAPVAPAEESSTEE
jgi:large subunit ribosomal protein L9